MELATPGAVRGATGGHGFAFWSTLAGMALTIVGMIGVAGAGPGDHGLLGLPTAALLAYGIGATVVARRVKHQGRSPRRG